MARKKPIHMTNGDITRTICGLSIDSPTAFSWVVPREAYKADVTCKRCLHGLKHGWGKEVRP